MKTVLVKYAFPYDGKRRNKGDKVVVADSHAAVLCAAGKAEEVVADSDTEVSTHTETQVENDTGSTLSLRRGRNSVSRGRYNRSDMRTEK
jgi:hypothetical protein